jgi:hypothetical protein
MVLERMLGYAAGELVRGTKLASITRHMTGLVNGRPGARKFRRLLTEESIKPGAGLEVLQGAIAAAREAKGRERGHDPAFNPSPCPTGRGNDVATVTAASLLPWGEGPDEGRDARSWLCPAAEQDLS